MNLARILTGLNKGWAVFIVIVASAGLGGGAYAAWTASLHVEGTVQTGDVNVVWDMQSDREFVGILDPATGQVVNSPIPPDKDFVDCLSSLEQGTTDRTVSFQVTNAYPSYTCEITLGALVTGSVPVHISNFQHEVLDAAGNDVLDTEINMSVDLMVKNEVEPGIFDCNPEQPVDVGTQLHRGDRFCAIISIHATEAAQQNHTYTGSLWIDLIQWNFSDTVVIPPNNAPLAVDDTFNALGNTELAVGLALPATPATELTGSVLDNDTDPDSDSLSAVPFVGTSANGGFVNLNAFGRFRYLPPVAFNGSDTFPYSVTDGNGGAANGLVTINVTDMVWYVDSSASVGGSGTSSSPFDTLLPLTTGGSADGSDGPGDIIFVHQGAGTTQGGIVLEPDQQLIGQGVGLSLPPFSPDPLVAASGEPTIFAATGSAIELSSGNTVRGLNVRSDSGDGIVGASVGTLTITDVPLVDAVGGAGLRVTGGTGAAVVIDSVVVNTSIGAGGIILANIPGSFKFTGVNITNTGGTGLSASNAGSLGVGGGATPSVINATDGIALNVTNTTIDAGGLTFQSISSSAGANGIVLNNTGSSGGLTVTGNTISGSGGVISSSLGDGISLINTEMVSLSLMTINQTDGSGISGDTVNGFTANGLDMTDIGNADGEHGITFDNLTGTNSVLGTTITRAADHNLRIVNTGGTMASLVVADSVFSGGATSTHSGSGVFVELSGPAVISNLEIGGGTPATDDANDTQFIDMDGFGIDLRGSVTGGTFRNVVIDDVQVLRANAGGVLLATDGPGATGSGTFSLTNSEIEGDNAAVIGVGADGNSESTVTIRNNTARVINPLFGISVIGARADGGPSGATPKLHITIESNSISGGDAFGINAAARGGIGSLDAKIVDNTIFDIGDDGVRLRAGNSAADADSVRVFLSDNDATTNVLGDGYDLRNQSASTTFQIACGLPACSGLIGTSTANDQGLIVLHGNLGTSSFTGITTIPPVFTIIDLAAVIAP